MPSILLLGAVGFCYQPDGSRREIRSGPIACRSLLVLPQQPHRKLVLIHQRRDVLLRPPALGLQARSERIAIDLGLGAVDE